MLMPILTLTRSAGVSRMVRAVNGSSSALPARPEVDQLHAAPLRGQCGPGGARALGDRALADRAAVVQPDRAVARGREHRRVGAQLDEVGGLAPRQPQLDQLVAVRQPDEPHGARRPRPGLGTAREVQHHLVATGDAHLRGQLAVDAEVVEAVRPRRHALVVRHHAVRVQLHLGGAGPEDQAYAGRLRLGHEQLPVGALRPRPGGQPVRQQPVLGPLQLDRAPDQVGGDRRGDPLHVAQPPHAPIRLKVHVAKDRWVADESGTHAPPACPASKGGGAPLAFVRTPVRTRGFSCACSASTPG